MSLAKRLALTGFVVAAVLVVASTGGLSAMTADRGVQVSVANDENAFLAIETNRITRCGTNHGVFEVQNQFGTDLTDFEAFVVEAHGVRASVKDAPDHLDDGDTVGAVDTGDIDIQVKALGPESDDIEPGSVTVHFEASGRGVGISLNRTVEADCAKSKPSQSNNSTSTPTPTPTPTTTPTTTST